MEPRDEKKAPPAGDAALNDAALDAAAGGAIIETEEPFIAQPGEELWQYRVFTPGKDGQVAAAALTLKPPLRAGQIEIVRGFLSEDGAVQPEGD